jgi:hypothetical protein
MNIGTGNQGTFSPRLIEDDKGDYHHDAPYYWSCPLIRLEQSQSSTFSRNRPALAGYVVHNPCSRSQQCKVVSCASRVNVNSHRPSTGQVTKVDQFICPWVIMTLLGICSVWKGYITSLRFPRARGGLREAKYSPHRALSGALSGPDSAALRRTVWSCRRVLLFDCGSYSNKKENRLLSLPEYVPVFRSMLHTWKVRASNSVSCCRT